MLSRREFLNASAALAVAAILGCSVLRRFSPSAFLERRVNEEFQRYASHFSLMPAGLAPAEAALYAEEATGVDYKTLDALNFLILEAISFERGVEKFAAAQKVIASARPLGNGSSLVQCLRGKSSGPEDRTLLFTNAFHLTGMTVKYYGVPHHAYVGITQQQCWETSSGLWFPGAGMLHPVEYSGRELALYSAVNYAMKCMDEGVSEKAAAIAMFVLENSGASATRAGANFMLGLINLVEADGDTELMARAKNNFSAAYAESNDPVMLYFESCATRKRSEASTLLEDGWRIINQNKALLVPLLDTNPVLYYKQMCRYTRSEIDIFYRLNQVDRTFEKENRAVIAVVQKELVRLEARYQQIISTN